MKHRLLMVGAGGMAKNWIRDFLPPFQDRIEIVGLVDKDSTALRLSGDFARIPQDARFIDISEAFSVVDADCCVVVVPPGLHREVVLSATRRKMHILSEKPVADTWEACIDIYQAVVQANVRMQLVQNYRYEPPIIAFREAIQSAQLGPLNYIVLRFLADYRQPYSWGSAFRHTMPHALLVEGAIHHFDLVRYFTNSDCRYISGKEWNPAWSSSKGEFTNLFYIEMANNSRAFYEGSGTAAGIQNSWDYEYYRAECQQGSIILENSEQVHISRWSQNQGLSVEEISPPTPEYTGHMHIIEEFLDWIDGGSAPPTQLVDNMKSAAMVFGAIEASRTNTVVQIDEMLNKVIF